jgi:hypothetical protein
MKLRAMPKIRIEIMGMLDFFIGMIIIQVYGNPKYYLLAEPPNGLRYLRWGGDGEAVQPGK